MNKKVKIATVASALSTANLAMSIGRDLREKWEQKFLYRATVSEDSYVFPYLMVWLNDRTKTRSVTFNATRGKIERYFNASGVSKINLDGHQISVCLSEPRLDKDSWLDDGAGLKKNVCFTSRTAAGIDAIEALLQELFEIRKKNETSIHLYTIGKYGWEGKAMPVRNIDSIFLPQGVKEDLLADVEGFFSNEEQFAKIGAPWHRGYLFHGPPGNGKSSMCAAIANHYKMNVYSLPLSSVKDDKALVEAINGVASRSMLLLEDIDVFSKAVGRTSDGTGPTLAGLLNALDGVATPHGLMTFMTTNHVENLDPALVRNGRIDKRVELLSPDTYQINSMFEYVFEEPLNVKPKAFESMAALAEVFKRNCTDPESARMEIKAL